MLVSGVRSSWETLETKSDLARSRPLQPLHGLALELEDAGVLVGEVVQRLGHPADLARPGGGRPGLGVPGRQPVDGLLHVDERLGDPRRPPAGPNSEATAAGEQRDSAASRITRPAAAGTRRWSASVSRAVSRVDDGGSPRRIRSNFALPTSSPGG